MRPSIINPKSVPDTIFHEDARGKIILTATIDTSGNAQNIRVSNSVVGSVDSIAVNRFKNYKFKPSIKYSSDYPNGRPVEYEVSLPFYVVSRKEKN